MSKVLLIEDDRFLGGLLNESLTTRGISVFAVDDGKDAFEIAKREKPSLIVLDIALPTKGGFEILGELKADEETKDITVIILTNLSQDSDKEKGMKLGAKEYLIKWETHIDDLIDHIVDMLKDSK